MCKKLHACIYIESIALNDINGLAMYDVCVYMYMRYTHTHARTHAGTHARTNTHIHTRTHARTHARTNTYKFTCTCRPQSPCSDVEPAVYIDGWYTA